MSWTTFRSGVADVLLPRRSLLCWQCGAEGMTAPRHVQMDWDRARAEREGAIGISDHLTIAAANHQCTVHVPQHQESGREYQRGRIAAADVHRPANRSSGG